MNKIKQILIGASMVALSGNAAAMIMNDDGSKTMEYSDYGVDFILKAIAGDFDDFTGKQIAKLDRKYGKILKKEGILDRGMYKGKELRAGKIARLDKKIARKKIRVAEYLSKIGGDKILLAINAEAGASENVPEPSTIALLGLGLIGIGAARRMRKKAS